MPGSRGPSGTPKPTTRCAATSPRVDTPGRPGRPPVQVAHLRAGRCPDPGGPAVRLVCLHRLESPGRRPDRGGACAAVGSRRPGRLTAQAVAPVYAGPKSGIDTAADF